MPKIVKPQNLVCKHCQHGKQTKSNFKSKEHATSHPLEIVHTNLRGPTRTKILQGEYYFMLFIDDYTRMTWVTFLKEKSESFDKFKIFKAKVENETNLKIKCLRSDMEVNSLQMNSMNFLKPLELKDSFHPPRLLYKMALWKEKIGQSKKLPELC